MRLCLSAVAGLLTSLVALAFVLVLLALAARVLIVARLTHTTSLVLTSAMAAFAMLGALAVIVALPRWFERRGVGYAILSSATAAFLGGVLATELLLSAAWVRGCLSGLPGASDCFAT